MSLLSPRLRLALMPGRAALADRHGRVEAADTAPGWEGAMAALARLLTERKAMGSASVVLSQHFVRFFLLPPPVVWLGRRDMQVWLAEQMQGPLDGSAGWQFLWQPAAPGRPVLACAAEGAMLEALRGTMAGNGVRLRHVQPRFAAAINHRRKTLRGVTGWYALLEPDMATLARLERGQMTALRQRQLGPDIAADLRGMIAREALLCGAPEGGELWLDTPGVAGHWHGLKDAGFEVRELPVRQDAMEAWLA